jgi:hypothetical protein
MVRWARLAVCVGVRAARASISDVSDVAAEQIDQQRCDQKQQQAYGKPSFTLLVDILHRTNRSVIR